MSVLVSLALATICFTYNGVEECHPVLLGKRNPTPTGQYQLIKREVMTPGYGGDVLQFKEDEDVVYAIHRLWLGIPSQNRQQRIKSPRISDRFISSGCINVEPEVYDRLVDCCSNQTLIIK